MFQTTNQTVFIEDTDMSLATVRPLPVPKHHYEMSEVRQLKYIVIYKWTIFYSDIIQRVIDPEA